MSTSPPPACAFPLLPGATLGVMGGGQLGRMFVHAAQQMGYFTAVLDPDALSPAGCVSHRHVQTDYLDAGGLEHMAQCCAAVTTEFENVPAAAMRALATACRVAPTADILEIAQDRAREKAYFVQCGVSCAPHQVLDRADQLAQVPARLLPGILKTARMGYDGKGQHRVRTPAELQAAWHALGGVPCVLEQMLPLALELSVLVARGHDGQMVTLPVQRNLHRHGILAVTEVHPQAVAPELAEQALQAARRVAAGLAYVGVLCVEFFVLQADSPQASELGRLVVNEMAPRPHNSGHYSLDACDQSQFDLQVRALAGLPLTPPRQHSPAIMLNLLGELWFPEGQSQARTPPWAQVLALPGAHLHLYGKEEARRGRKMGHLTFTGPDLATVRHHALQAAALLGIEAF